MTLRLLSASWPAALLLTTLCALVSCGPQAQDFTGTYQGTLTRVEERGVFTFTPKFNSYSVFIAPGEKGELLVQLRDECAVRAELLDDASFEIPSQPCTEQLDSASLDATLQGSGTLSGDTLTLSFGLEGTGRLGDDTYAYTSTETFSGARQ